MRAVLAGLLVLSLATPTRAQIENCAWIERDADRLSCYDDAALMNEAPDLPDKSPEHISFFQDGFARQWDRYFGRNKIHVNAYVQTAADGRELVFSGAASEGYTKELIERAGLLAKAKEFGFIRIVFVHRPNSARTVFEIR